MRLGHSKKAESHSKVTIGKQRVLGCSAYEPRGGKLSAGFKPRHSLLPPAWDPAACVREGGEAGGREMEKE